MDEELIIGKLAYKKQGFFSGLVGTIQENDKGISRINSFFDSERQ